MVDSRKQKHTPGPWNLHIGLDYFEIENATGICVLPETRCNPENELDVADARLMAAAPDMLKALRALINLTDQGREGGLILSRADHKPITNGDQEVIDNAYIAADAAIRKAVDDALCDASAQVVDWEIDSLERTR